MTKTIVITVSRISWMSIITTKVLLRFNIKIQEPDDVIFNVCLYNDSFENLSAEGTRISLHVIHPEKRPAMLANAFTERGRDTRRRRLGNFILSMICQLVKRRKQKK